MTYAPYLLHTNNSTPALSFYIKGSEDKMKSTLTYEMHNYAAVSTPKLSEAKTATKKDSKRTKNYSLRQRQKRRHDMASLDEALDYTSDNSNNDPDAFAIVEPIKYTGKRSESANVNKAKTKAAPLSKYRRKTANARERTRMREINSAFENLRYCVPHTITGEDSGSTNEKLTKITTLRLAMKYISILSEALANPDFEADFLLECKKDGDHRFTTHNWKRDDSKDAENSIFLNSAEEQESDEKQTPPPKAKNTKSPVKANAVKSTANSSRKSPPKRQSKKQKLQQATLPYATLSTASICSNESVSSASSTSAYASLTSSATCSNIASPPSSTVSSSSYLLDSSLNLGYITHATKQSMSDLSTLILESDGESLHLSEHCLSPLQSNYTNILDCGVSNEVSVNLPNRSTLSRYDMHNDSIATMSTLENPLELSLRLLESSADSLEFSVSDQQPPSCISPLVTLDSFNPFGDLLHSDFPEHSALDLFLT